MTSSTDGGPAATAEAVAAAVDGLTQVRLAEGSVVATHLPGRRVPGVRVRDDGVEVHVAVVYPTTVDEAAAAVRDAVGGVTGGPVHVVVDDVVLADDETDDGADDETDDAPDTGGGR